MEDSKKEPSVLNAGLDEVGMGTWAGPLFIVVAAFSEKQCPVDGVADSKKLTSKRRKELAPLIVKAAAYTGIGWSSAHEIDRHGVKTAWERAAVRALKGAPELNHLYIDGRRRVYFYDGAQSLHDKGESKHWQIAAASIVAKVLRDNEMEWMAQHYPEYSSWTSNSGYGTKEHQRSLISNEPTPLHRMYYLRKFVSRNRPYWMKNYLEYLR